MAHVLCEVSRGLRESERTVAVRDVHGRRQFLRVEADFLTVENGRSYLPVGIVYEDQAKQVILIELPHEADSGAHRLWVRSAEMLEQSRAPA
jgi:hypothetical protein